MKESERNEILAFLQRGSTALADAVQDVSDELAARIPGPGKWSILQCAEHVAITEEGLFSLILASRLADAPQVNAEREAKIVARGADRSRRVESPEDVRPAGRFETLVQAFQHFLASRERTIEFAKTCDEDLRARIAPHPLLGMVNCHEMLLLMAAHPLRHARQIEEIKAALG
jgi:uncharacterized damage-inducible protein DinB